LNWREIAGLDDQEKSIASPLVEKNLSEANNRGASRPLIVVSNTTGDVNDVEQAINGLVGTLCEMLRRLTRKAGDLLRADRTSIFLLDQHRRVLGTVVADDGEGGGLVIDIPVGKGIAGLAATSSQVINVPFDVYDDPRSEEAKKTDHRTGYRTYTILAFPVLNKQKDLVAVVQLINKLKPNHDPEDDLSRRIDTNGFTKEDEARFAKFAPSILKLLEKCQFCYQLSLKLRNNAGVNQAGAFQNAELIAQLKRQERLLRNSLNRFKLEDKSSRKQKARR
ncbi:MAG: GAF domain-containing protein, partial [Microcoleus sp. SIO2G3]|nr:GAF domain-containing protein [Microcoleus sp. SIO2G3]